MCIHKQTKFNSQQNCVVFFNNLAITLFRRTQRTKQISYKFKMDQEILIIAVQKRPCIFDKSDPNYHNREYLRKSWDEISFEVNETSKFYFSIIIS